MDTLRCAEERPSEKQLSSPLDFRPSVAHQMRSGGLFIWEMTMRQNLGLDRAVIEYSRKQSPLAIRLQVSHRHKSDSQMFGATVPVHPTSSLDTHATDSLRRSKRLSEAKNAANEFRRSQKWRRRKLVSRQLKNTSGRS